MVFPSLARGRMPKISPPSCTTSERIENFEARVFQKARVHAKLWKISDAELRQSLSHSAESSSSRAKSLTSSHCKLGVAQGDTSAIEADVDTLTGPSRIRRCGFCRSAPPHQVGVAGSPM